MANKNILTAGELKLPASLSSDILAEAQSASAIQQLATQVALPGTGSSIHVITGDSEAAWVEEGGEKPVSKPSVTQKLMTPHKLAVIEVFSKELIDDAPALYNELKRRLPGALGRKFDQTILNGTAPGSGFDVLTNAPEISVATKGWYKGSVEAMKSIAKNRGALTGFAVTPFAEADILGELDGNKRPLFISNPQTEGAIGSILGRPVYKSEHIDKYLGVAGDWSTARWGVVNGIEVRVSDQATVNTGDGQPVNLWQTNQVAVLVEARYGFVVGNENKFARLTDSKQDAELTG